MPIAVLALGAVAVGLKLPPKEDQENFKAKLKRIDFSGAFTLVTAVFTLLLALDRGGNVSWTDHFTVATFTVSVVAFLAFLAIELRVAPEPIAPAYIIGNSTLFAIYMANLLMVGANMTMLFSVPLYLQAVRQFTPSQVGLTLLSNVIAGAVGSVTTGLTMKATGKYYWLTITTFTLSFIGDCMIAGVTGLVAFHIAILCTGEDLLMTCHCARSHLSRPGFDEFRRM